MYYCIIGYFIIYLITAFALIEELKFNDVVASFLTALFWPIFIPSRILRKILK